MSETTPTSPAGLRVLLEKFPGLFKTLERLEFMAGMAANQDALDYEVTFTPVDAKLFAADIRALVNNAEQLIGAAERADHLQVLLDNRDGFICRKGLWDEFVDQLPDEYPQALGAAEPVSAPPTTRNLVYRFFQLRLSEKRDIIAGLGLEYDTSLPEFERFKGAFVAASNAGKLEAMAAAISEKEASNAE